MPRGGRSTFPWPMQRAQAAAKGFDLLLIGRLLPLGQLQRFQHSLHVVQGPAEHLDDLVHLLDCPLNCRWRCGQPVALRRWGSLSFYWDGFCYHLSGYHRLLSRLRRCLCGWRLLWGGWGPPPPAAAPPAARTSAPAAGGGGGRGPRDT